MFLEFGGTNPLQFKKQNQRTLPQNSVLYRETEITAPNQVILINLSLFQNLYFITNSVSV